MARGGWRKRGGRRGGRRGRLTDGCRRTAAANKTLDAAPSTQGKERGTPRARTLLYKDAAGRQKGGSREAAGRRRGGSREAAGREQGGGREAAGRREEERPGGKTQGTTAGSSLAAKLGVSWISIRWSTAMPARLVQI